MQIKTLVKDNVQVLRMTTLDVGDVYKRLVSSSYAGEKEKLVFGIVTGAMNNGEQVALSAVELDITYSTVTVSAKAFSSETDLVMFPASHEELAAHTDEVLHVLRRNVRQAEDSLAEAQKKLTEVGRLLGRAMAPNLDQMRAQLDRPSVIEN